MTRRLKIICSHLEKGQILADVGCDHGLVAEYALKNDLFEKVVISDISSKSLNKAQKLLEKYGDRVISIVCDGFSGYGDIVPSTSVIAGMGGEEIFSILKTAKTLSQKLVLAPQKNSHKVRSFLIENGYNITCDYTIKDDKFYDIIVAEKGKSSYSQLDILFGRDNLQKKGKDFLEKLEKERNFYNALIKSGRLNEESLLAVQKKLELIREVLNERSTN